MSLGPEVQIYYYSNPLLEGFLPYLPAFTIAVEGSRLTIMLSYPYLRIVSQRPERSCIILERGSQSQKREMKVLPVFENFLVYGSTSFAEVDHFVHRIWEGYEKPELSQSIFGPSKATMESVVSPPDEGPLGRYSLEPRNLQTATPWQRSPGTLQKKNRQFNNGNASKEEKLNKIFDHKNSLSRFRAKFVPLISVFGRRFQSFTRRSQSLTKENPPLDSLSPCIVNTSLIQKTDSRFVLPTEEIVAEKIPSLGQNSYPDEIATKGFELMMWSVTPMAERESIKLKQYFRVIDEI
ncbi:hypothetical protein BT96DRAFT_951246 [Gymnopus androsaceus JB14]|uniref:Uncharacterized protein n=1 Tax=Gymnopus androsaceus JB14 TaxID=1447944 RepID=A0A6A4GDA8_9AGAR|nr:hypothetical protein BT96DRAFT_951246 [Gymnopus androsaceus JB14]